MWKEKIGMFLGNFFGYFLLFFLIVFAIYILKSLYFTVREWTASTLIALLGDEHTGKIYAGLNVMTLLLVVFAAITTEINM